MPRYIPNIPQKNVPKYVKTCISAIQRTPENMSHKNCVKICRSNFWSEKHFSGMIPGSFWHHSGIIQGSSRHHFKLVLGDFRVIFRSKKSRSQNRRMMTGASCRSCLVLFPPSLLIKKHHFFMKY